MCLAAKGGFPDKNDVPLDYCGYDATIMVKHKDRKNKGDTT